MEQTIKVTGSWSDTKVKGFIKLNPETSTLERGENSTTVLPTKLLTLKKPSKILKRGEE